MECIPNNLFSWVIEYGYNNWASLVSVGLFLKINYIRSNYVYAIFILIFMDGKVFYITWF